MSDATWGDGFLAQLSRDLMAGFPQMQGFSLRNLKYIRQWNLFYSAGGIPIGQQVVAQLSSVPWGHNLVIVSKCRTVPEGLYQRDGKAITNFAQQTLKDPYMFDFLSLRSDYNERELEMALVDHVSQFLLELGAGFAYLGRQVPLQVGEREFFLDLLFYHTRLHCYVVVELKAIDEQRRGPGDQPTVGLLLCKNKDKLVAEYALSDMAKPLGVSEYQLNQALPAEWKSSLPTIEELEAEFGGKE